MKQNYDKLRLQQRLNQQAAERRRIEDAVAETRRASYAPEVLADIQAQLAALRNAEVRR